MSTNTTFCYKYPHPAVATDCAIFGFDGQALKVLLIQRGEQPFKDLWALPGGFMNIDETADQCAKRELFEETGLNIATLYQIGAYTEVKRDPRERVISIAYYSLVKISEVRGGDDALKAQWFKINEVPQLAFDHTLILNNARQILKSQLQMNPIGLSLMENDFNYTDLKIINSMLDI